MVRGVSSATQLSLAGVACLTRNLCVRPCILCCLLANFGSPVGTEVRETHEERGIRQYGVCVQPNTLPHSCVIRLRVIRRRDTSVYVLLRAGVYKAGGCSHILCCLFYGTKGAHRAAQWQYRGIQGCTGAVLLSLFGATARAIHSYALGCFASLRCTQGSTGAEEHRAQQGPRN